MRVAPACAASGTRAVSLSAKTISSGLTPISCAAIWHKPVKMPSPISVTPVAILTVPPSSISTQTAARSIAAVRAMPYQPQATPRPCFFILFLPALGEYPVCMIDVCHFDQCLYEFPCRHHGD